MAEKGERGGREGKKIKEWRKGIERGIESNRRKGERNGGKYIERTRGRDREGER